MRTRFIALLLLVQLTASLARAQATPVAPPRAELPITTISLFSSGVGYFEHSGSVRDNAGTELHFKTSQINDMLKSLVLQDLDGGRVSAVTYPSQDPLSKTLKSFQVDIGSNPSLADLLTQLRGARVTTVSQAERVSGTILGVESRRTPVDKGEPVQESVLNVITNGMIRAIPLRGVSSVSLDDPQLQDEITRALTALTVGRDQDRKPVAITFNGSGQRRVRVGYLVETPVWKTSYRLLLDDKGGKLQGWAIVENQTESDWNGVSLSLVSGRPISFMMDLYQPLYVQRQTVVSTQFASLRPQVYEGGTAADLERVRFGLPAAGRSTLTGVVKDISTGAPVPGVTVKIAGTSNQVSTDDRGIYRIPNLTLGSMVTIDATRMGYSGSHVEGVRLDQPVVNRDLEVNPSVMSLNAVTTSATGDPTSGVRMPMAMTRMDIDGQAGPIDPFATVRSVAATARMGALFQYTVSNVTLPRQKSAMLPIVTDTVGLERVSIYNASVLAVNPLNGVLLRNTTGKHLLQGPVTVLDRGNYAGDARIDDVPAGQERLLSYGIDLEMLMDNKKNSQTTNIVTGRLVKGVLYVDRRTVASQQYLADNKGTVDKTLIVEHPIRGGWTLVDTQSPFETTPGLYRFKGSAPAGKVTTLTVTEQVVNSERTVILNTDTELLLSQTRNAAIPVVVRDAIAKAVALRQAMLDLDREAASRTAQIADITTEQERIRENIKVGGLSTQYRDRLLTKLNEQETSIEKLQRERGELTTKRDAARKAMEDYINGLTIG